MEFNFAQNQTVDDVATVPESFRSVYVAGQDGKHTINPDLVTLTTALDGLNGALRKERDTVKALKTQPTAATVLEALGFPDVDAAKARLGELETTIAERAKVDPAKIKADIEATFNNERQGFKTQLGEMESTLFEHLVQNTARAALSEHKGNELFLMPHIEKQTKVVKDEGTGKYVTRVIDADGSYRGNGQGGFMTVPDLVGEMKANKSFAGAFESGNQPGGAQPNVQNRPAVRQVVGQTNQGQKTPTEKISAGIAALQRA